MHALQEVWETRPLNLLDPTRKFSLACSRVRNKYQDIQTMAKKKEDPLDTMHTKLVQLKLDILEDSSLFQNEEFQTLRSQIREAKLTKAN